MHEDQAVRVANPRVALAGRPRPRLRLELDNHLDLLARDYRARGMPADEAERAARVRLGGVAQLKETNRELRGLPLLDTFVQDARYALRTLRKNPGFATVAVLTLALGIGANTAIFSVVHAVLLKPLPYAQPGPAVQRLSRSGRQDETATTGWSYPNFEELRDQNRIFSEVAAQPAPPAHADGSRRAVGREHVGRHAGPVLAARRKATRRPLLSEDDGKAGAAPVVVLSEEPVARTFGADPAIVGTSIDLDKRSFTVVGIMPATFRFPRVTEGDQLWIALLRIRFRIVDGSTGGHWLQVTGRLRPGVSPAQARAELEALRRGSPANFPPRTAGGRFAWRRSST